MAGVEETEDPMSDGMKHLGEAITRLHGGMAGVAVSALSGLGDAHRHQERLWRAVERLAMVIPSGDREAALAEVERRKALMGEAAAYESVGDDVVAGRWPR